MTAEPSTEPQKPAPVASSTLLRTLMQPRILALIAIIVLAVGLRLAWIGYVSPNPSDGRMDDTLFYDRAGWSLAQNRGYLNFSGYPTAQWPPAYPFLLAGIYKAFGHNITAPKVVNALAGGLTCLLIYLIAARVFDRRVGLLAAFMFAIFPGQLFWSTLLMTESLTPALLCLILLLFMSWVIERRDAGPLRHAILGATFGILVLARGEGPVLVLGALVIWRIVAPSWRQWAKEASVFTAVAVLVVVPWTIRNAISMHAFIPVMSAAGHTALAGHQSDPYSIQGLFPEAKIQEKYADVPYPEREIKVENEAMRTAISWAVHHPLEESYYPFVKFYRFFASDADAVGWVNSWKPGGTLPAMLGPRAKDFFSTVANAYYIPLMVIAGLSVPLWFSIKDKHKLLLILLVLGWLMPHLLLFPTGRYHTALSPVFTLWAAAGLVFAFDLLRRRWQQRGVAEVRTSL
jgi:4-amino-4-deoxy-L-arabinose transferase-like glycosyltransferase